MGKTAIITVRNWCRLLERTKTTRIQNEYIKLVHLSHRLKISDITCHTGMETIHWCIVNNALNMYCNSVFTFFHTFFLNLFMFLGMKFDRVSFCTNYFDVTRLSQIARFHSFLISFLSFLYYTPLHTLETN